MKREISYSPAYTLVPTYECFNRCSYCNFRQEPGQSPGLSREVAAGMLRSLQGRVTEILLLSGEVHLESPRRSAWFERIYDLCQLAIDAGFLPHTNAGVLSYGEMAKLKDVNASMGLMLEQLAPSLRSTVHRYAPSKEPSLRWQQLEWAGVLQIPFTTGLLLGIGETEADWRETLGAIAFLHQRWHHIQEVILQPYSPGARETQKTSPFAAEQLVKVVELARNILPDAIALQIPPNLVASPQILLDCLSAGARDLGGIGPKDEVNPNYAHPTPESLAAVLAPAGWQLVSRLPVYPQYYSWLSPPLVSRIQQILGSKTFNDCANCPPDNPAAKV